MKDNNTRPAALAAVFSLTAILLWWGIPKTKDNPVSSQPTSAQERTGAAERLAGMREQAQSAARSVRDQQFQTHVRKKTEPVRDAFVLKHRTATTPNESGRDWRAHAVRQGAPLVAKLPKGTVIYNGQPAHPSRVIARVKHGMSLAD